MKRLAKHGQMEDKWKLLFTLHFLRFRQFFLLNHMISLTQSTHFTKPNSASLVFLRIKIRFCNIPVFGVYMYKGLVYTSQWFFLFEEWLSRHRSPQTCSDWEHNVFDFGCVSLTHHDPKVLGLICLVKKRKIYFRILSDLKIQCWFS